MPRLSYGQIQQSGPWGNDVFLGKVLENPASWRSLVPNVEEYMDTVQIDPALAMQGIPGLTELVGTGKQSAFDNAWSFIANRELQNVVGASRQMLGSVVRTTGLASRDFRRLTQVFREDQGAAMNVVNVAQGIVESELFAVGLDALGAIPVVGWIAKVGIEIARTVVSIMEASAANDLAVAYRQIAKSLSVPASALGFSVDADEVQTQMLFNAIGPDAYDPQSVISPAYNPMAGGGVNWKADGVYDDGAYMASDPKKIGMGWIVSADASGGMGFVPGTGNMTRTFFFPAGVVGGAGSTRLGAVIAASRDLGSLYPTAQGVANAWWSMVLQPGAPMFSVNPRKARDDWEDYIYAVLALAHDLLKGWSSAPTGIPFTDKFWCVNELMGRGNNKKEGMGSCKKSKSGDKLTIPEDFGRYAHSGYASYAYNLFFGSTDRSKVPLTSAVYYQDDLGHDYPDPDSINYANSVPSKALDNLRTRQYLTLQSMQAMYVDGYDPVTFPAFTDHEMKVRWEDSAQALVESGDWRDAVFVDMPDGPLKDAVAQLAIGSGIEPEDMNRPCPPSQTYCPGAFDIVGEGSVLGDPELPDVDAPVDVDVAKAVLAGDLKKKKKRSSSSFGLGAGLALLGLGAVVAKSR